MFSLEDRISGKQVFAVLSERSGFSILARFPVYPGVFRWIFDWFVAYHACNLSQGIGEPEFSFLYMIPGRTRGLPTGIVDGVEVLEAGFGGAAMGPADGIMVPVSELLSAFGKALDGPNSPMT
jgi:hypothetical protein